MGPPAIWHLFLFGHQAPEDTHSWGQDKASSLSLHPHAHTHCVAYKVPYISLVGDTFSFSCVTSSPWSHEGSNSSCEEHTEEHLYIRTGVCEYVCVCVHVLVSLVWAEQVSSDITLSSLWNYSFQKITVTEEEMQQIGVKPQLHLWAGWVNCHKV